jgi:copper resistance protein C
MPVTINETALRQVLLTTPVIGAIISAYFLPDFFSTMMRLDLVFSFKRLIFAGLLTLSLAPVVGFSHAILVKSQPAADSTVDQSPKQVDVWFNDKVGSEYKALAVIDSAGKRMDNKDIVQETFDPSHLYITVPDLAPGIYTVRYRVVSLDTHIVTGKFKFTVKTP